MSGFLTDLTEGLAVWTAAGVAGVTYRPSGRYDEGETGVVSRKVPQQPDRLITISARAIGDDPSLSDSDFAVQVRCRWGGEDERPADDLDDAIFDLWHGKTDLLLTTAVYVVQILRRSHAPLGQDELKRWSTSSNYVVTAHRPSANRT